MNSSTLSRRELLQAAGALVVSFSVAGAATTAGRRAAGRRRGRHYCRPSSIRSSRSCPTATVTAFFGKIDVGHGIEVAIGQIVAEELDVALDRVTVVMGDTARTTNQGGASGSHGIKLGGKAMRNAAAEARRILVERAAAQLSLPAGQLAVTNGVVSAATMRGAGSAMPNSSAASYFHCQARMEQRLRQRTGGERQGDAQERRPSTGSSANHSRRRSFLPRSRARAHYVSDISVPGMLHGRMIRPPNAGVSVVAVDEQFDRRHTRRPGAA